jgi:hypothetical protein
MTTAPRRSGSRLALETPAPIGESTALFTAELAQLKRWQSRAATLQLLKSDTVAFRLAGELVAAAGFYPIPSDVPGEELAEVWFVCRPSLAPHIGEFVRLARLTCLRASHCGAVRLRAHVRRGHRPGSRLAVLCSFEKLGEAGGFEVWEWRGGQIHSGADGHRQVAAPGAAG